MSLMCGETEENCPGSKKVYAVSHPLGDGYAVSQAPVERIPESDRRPRPCERFEEGLNISEGTGTKGSSGNWQFSTFKRGKFLFSISEEVALRYLPRTLERIREDIRGNAS